MAIAGAMSGAGAEKAQAAPRRTQAQRREASDGRLMSAAARIIADEGYAAATLERVGEAAGFSRGLASRKYGSKDGLIEAVIRHVSAHVNAQVDAALEGVEAPARQVLVLFDRFVALVQVDVMVRAYFVLFSAMIANRLETRTVFAEVQQQFGAVAGLADRALGFLRLGLQPLLLQGGADGRAEQLAEVALHVLPDIVGGPGLERRHGDARILGPGHVDHRQVDGDALDLGQHVEARLVGQIVIERDGIEFFAGQEREPFVARTDVPDTNAVRCQRALHQPANTRIVVDVEDPDLIHRQSVAGTCITERKRPSCWMALAKLS